MSISSICGIRDNGIDEPPQTYPANNDKQARRCVNDAHPKYAHLVEYPRSLSCHQVPAVIVTQLSSLALKMYSPSNADNRHGDNERVSLWVWNMDAACCSGYWTTTSIVCPSVVNRRGFFTLSTSKMEYLVVSTLDI